MPRRALATFLPIIVFAGLTAACGPKPPVHEVIEARDGAVRIPLAEIDDGAVHFYSYAHDGINVNFLVRTDGAGALQAHLDACYSCYRYRRGFVVEDDDLVCVACRLEYAIADEVWDFIGACAPISIHSAREDHDLVIDQRLLDRAAKYF